MSGSKIVCSLPLTRGKCALVDEDDYERVVGFKWTADPHRNGDFYASRHDGRHKVYLHRFILGITDSRKVDHENGNGLDCRRANLRIATTSENGQNRRRPNRNSTTGERGVVWHAQSGRYWAYLKVNGRQVSLRTHKTLEEATAAVEAGRALYMTHAPESPKDKHGAIGMATEPPVEGAAG